MTNDKYILSICIPTYNREKKLKGLIENIINQKGFSEKVQIYIYDDPSTDNTQLMVQYYIKKYSNIHYHRNSTRRGMMPSILDSILQCSGQYVWLFGSDDFMGPFGLSTILSLIEKEKPDLILSNFGRGEKNIDYKNDKIKYKTYNNVADFCNNFWKQNSEYSNPGVTDRYAVYFSYMSIYCFSSETFKSLYDIALTQNEENYILTHYFNYIYILLGNNKIKHICLCSSPTLTYMIGGGGDSRTMNAKIMKNVYSVFRMLNKQYHLKIKTKLLFIRLTIFWFETRCIAKIAIFAKRLGFYNKLSHVWRKYVLKSE